MNQPTFTVFLVDDDESVLRSLRRLLGAAGYAVRAYASSSAFLAEHDPEIPGCAVLDVSLPDLDGLEVQVALAAGSVPRQVVFLTGAGDIPTSVTAMKAGAVDFLTKPARRDQLVAAIESAVARDSESRRIHEQVSAVDIKLASLTPREREVFDRVIVGRLNKQIADELGTSIKTVKVHRGRMTEKMQARTVAELVRMAAIAGIGPAVADRQA
jgi:FixJ family two-component response regulator